MAAKVQLDIESRANTQALKDARAELERLGMSGQTTNQVFKSTGDLEVYKKAMVENYESARLFGDQMKATRTAFSDTNRAIKAAQTYLGKDDNNMFSFIDEQGVRQQTRDMDIIEKQIRGFLGNVMGDTNNYVDSMTRRLGEFKGFESFNKGLEKTASGYSMVGDELGAVQYKMGEIKNQIISMQSGETKADPEDVQKLANEYKKLSEQHATLAKEADGTGTRIKHLLKNFISAQLIVWALRTAVSGLTNGLKDSSKAAAEAEQTFGRFDAVFEGLERANDAIQNMVDNFGVANSSAADILSSIGNTALGFGASAMEAAQFSETVAASLSDIMAFRDVQGTISDFAQRFMSGASGNVENFRSLGSIVRQTMIELELQKQGWENLTGQSLEWAKVQARVNIVMEQQRKAMGATEREWDTMLSIQRRNQEATKELKENVGEAVNKFFKPMSEWILTLKENWNAAAEAKDNYNNGEYNPVPAIDYKDTPTARVMQNEIEKYSLTLSQMASSDPIGVMKGVDYKSIGFSAIEDFAKRYGATLRYTAEIAQKTGINISDSVWVQIDAYDAYIKKVNDYRRAESDRIATSQAAADALKDFSADLGSMMNLGQSGGMPDVMSYIGKDPADFVTPLERLLGFDGGEQGELEAKIKSLSDMVESLFNASISGATEYIRNQASEMLLVVSGALKDAKKAKSDIDDEENIKDLTAGYQEQVNIIRERIELSKYSASLEGRYSEEAIALMVQRNQQEAEALAYMNDQIEAGMDAIVAENYRLQVSSLITEEYENQLELLKKQSDEKQADALAAARESIVGIRVQRSLVGATEAEKAQASIDEQVYAFAETLVQANVEFSKVIEETTKYRMQLEFLAAEESYQAVKDSINATWGSIGDVGMLDEWKKTFDAVKKYAIKVLGDNDDDATAKAWGSTLQDVILEFATRLESVNSIMSMVSRTFDAIAPVVDDFLAPLLPVLDIVLGMLVDNIIPVLEMLFPVIQLFGVLLVGVTTTTKIVMNAFSWLVRTINVAIYNLTHWFNPKEWPNLVDETVAIMEEGNAAVQSIWAMEINAREDFISELTDVQKGQLDAYNEMFKSGMLTLSEYQALVGQNVYGQNFDGVAIESFAKGGDFVTTGRRLIEVGEAGPEHVTITPLNSTKYAERSNTSIRNSSYSVVVNGANSDPEDIAIAVRREFTRMERRGVKYA